MGLSPVTNKSSYLKSTKRLLASREKVALLVLKNSQAFSFEAKKIIYAINRKNLLELPIVKCQLERQMEANDNKDAQNSSICSVSYNRVVIDCNFKWCLITGFASCSCIFAKARPSIHKWSALTFVWSSTAVIYEPTNICAIFILVSLFFVWFKNQPKEKIAQQSNKRPTKTGTTTDLFAKYSSVMKLKSAEVKDNLKDIIVNPSNNTANASTIVGNSHQHTQERHVSASKRNCKRT
uniref:Uncharacterized protein n=1 Tax=Glossina pallidipes TaxID=7398 RepID=A0A1A9ZW22_GLOPL